MEPQSIGDAIAEAKIEGLLEKLKARRLEFQAQLETAPRYRICKHHSDQQEVLLTDESWEKGQLFYSCQRCETEAKSRKRLMRIAAVGIPQDVHHATLENFDTERQGVNPAYQTPLQFLQAADKFSRGEARNLILAGKPGIGKGHLASAIAILAMDKGESVAWIDCAGLFGLYHRAYENDRTEDIVRRFANADLTVLDEICLRSLPADGEEILFAILDKRQKAGRQTILLGNLPAGPTRDWLGGRIYDRLKSGGCLFRYGEWESMRGTDRDGAGEF